MTDRQGGIGPRFPVAYVRANEEGTVVQRLQMFQPRKLNPAAGGYALHMRKFADYAPKIIPHSGQDTPLAGMWTGLRTLRFADGPDAVHRMVIARKELKQYINESLEG